MYNLQEQYNWEAPEESEAALLYLDEDGMPDILFSDNDDVEELIEGFQEAFPDCELLDIEPTLEGAVGNLVQRAKMAGSHLLVSKDKLRKIQQASGKEHKAAGRKQYKVEYKDADSGKVGSKVMWAKSPSQARIFLLADMHGSEHTSSRSQLGGDLGQTARSVKDFALRGSGSKFGGLSKSASVRITGVKEVNKHLTMARRPGEVLGHLADKTDRAIDRGIKRARSY
jgi:hypothetical protein